MGQAWSHWKKVCAFGKQARGLGFGAKRITLCRTLPGPGAETPHCGHWKQPKKGVRSGGTDGRLRGMGNRKTTEQACVRALFGMVRQWLY